VVSGAGAGWRLRVEHTTVYRYSSPVRASYNELRLVPQTTPRQTALDCKVSTTPGAPFFRYRDYWGTEVVAFEVPGLHDTLAVRSTALVETHPTEPPGEASWADVLAAADRFSEMLVPSTHTAPDAALVEVAEALRAPTPLETVHQVAAWVHETMAYVPGSTGVHTTAIEAWREASGVCQDFAHLASAILRVLHVPARYASGYLHPDPGAARDSQVTGESHAWVEAWTGSWWGIDPTNDLPAGERHVVVAYGRDYADVPPVKGIYAGTADDDLEVEVRITRLR
jgi:transglutaminase-like putative cysteine protease